MPIDFDDDYGTCSNCGSAWFELAPPPEADLANLDEDHAAVCIDRSGTVTGYAGVLRCTECGALWSDPLVIKAVPAPRPRLFLVPPLEETEEDTRTPEEIEDERFVEMMAEEADAAMVLSFTQRVGAEDPEIDVTGMETEEDWDRALALALRGVVRLTLNSLGFFTDDEIFFTDDTEEDDED